MRGEVCIGFASVLSLASMVLLIFVHVGQINLTKVPRSISMVKVNVSAYSEVLETFTFNPVSGLYTANSTAPLQAAAGLRQYYEFGLYSYCAFVSSSNATNPTNATVTPFVNSTDTPNPSLGPGAGICSNTTVARPFKPFDYITSDMTSFYKILSNNFVPETTFRDSKYMGNNSKAAYWMLLLGTICVALALITGIAKNHLTFFLSAIFSVLSAILLLVSAALWTVLIKKAQSVNNIHLSIPNTTTQIPVGIVVSEGTGFLILWAAFACATASVIPYLISCCTYRG